MPAQQNTQSATLDLVFFPIANSLVSGIVGNSHAESILRESDFYMIGGRAQASFDDFDFDKDTGLLHFSIQIAGGRRDSGAIEILELPPFREMEGGREFEIRTTDFCIEILMAEGEGREATAVSAFIPEDVLMRRGRKEKIIHGFDAYLELATYDLLYVGIAKVGDTYDRLFASAHRARMDILSDEPQRFPGARVSDEIYLFAFKVEPLLVRMFTQDSEIEPGDMDMSYDQKRLVADAEKAMVSLLKPSYNRSLYPNYPKGRDGLYKTGLTAYTYSISEGMAFRTAYGTIKGGRERHFTMSNDADFIMVRGDEVTFHIAGVDFAAE